MEYPKNLIGVKFNRLTVIDSAEKPKDYKDRHSFWVCKCECGNTITIGRNRLVTGQTKSCGCLKIEKVRENGLNNKKHGLKNHRIYQIWRNMISRCEDPKNKMYSYYGGRGITVCNEWRGNDGLVLFYDWSINNGYDESLTIDRISSNGNYEPSNCRWETMEVQNKNKRNNIKITIENVEFESLKDVSKRYNVSYSAVYARYKRGLRGLELISGLVVDRNNT